MTDWICPPDTFRELVAWTGLPPRRAVEVPGAVNMSGLHLKRPIHFRSVTFLGHFRADHADFDGRLTFEDCHFRQGADLRGSKVGGSLKFIRCTFGTPAHLSGGRRNISLWLDHVQVEGNVVIDGGVKQQVLAGTLSAQGATITGDLRFSTARIATDRGISTQHSDRHASVDLSRAIIRGNLDLAYGETVASQSLREREQHAPHGRASEFRGDFIADQLQLNGYLLASIAGVQIDGPLLLNGASLGGVEACNVSIGGGLEAKGLACRMNFEMQHCRIGSEEQPGDLDFSGAKLGGQLHLSHLERGGKIDLKAIRCGSFVLRQAIPNSHAFNALDAVDSTFSSYVWLINISVRRRRPQGARLDREASKASCDGIRFHACRFENGLEFWEAQDRSEAGNQQITAFRTACGYSQVEGSLVITDCHIAGDLDLTRIQLLAPGGDISRNEDGTIAIDRTKVTGAVRFCSPESFSNRRRVAPEAKEHGQKLAHSEDRLSWEGARATRLRFSGSTANDIDLTGLELVTGVGCGSVDASRSVVKGTFKVYDILDPDDASIKPPDHDQRRQREPPSAHTVIPGALNLRYSTIGELVVSAKSFRDPSEDAHAHQCGVVLEHASIGHLRVPQLAAEEGCKGFPVPLDLSNVEVSAWSFSARGTDSLDEFAESEKYLDILDNDQSLHRPIYRSIYRQMRDAGHDKAARRIYIAEAYRASWESLGGWARGTGRHSPGWHRLGRVSTALSWQRTRIVFRRLPNFLLSWSFLVFLRYGVSPWRLFGAIALLFMVSFLLVAREPANFELDEPVRVLLARAAAAEISDGGAMAAARAVPPGLATVLRGYEYCDDGTVLGPHPGRWSWREALWMTVRYHIPLVGLMTRSDFAATDDRGVQIAPLPGLIPARDRHCVAASPAWESPRRLATHHRAGGWALTLGVMNADDWFGLMSLLNWIMWPVLLTFVLRKVLRD